MTHSAEPDDEQPRPTSHAKSEPQIESPSAAPRVPSRVVVAVPIVISLVALGVASWALWRGFEKTPPPTEQQVSAAKADACAAYTRVRSAVALQTQVDTGADPNAAPFIALNGRMAMAVGSQHIVDNLSPAVPSELADLLRSVATGLQDLTMNAMAGTGGDEASQVARLRELEATSQKIVALCT